ncbi:MAG: hypothetical protein GWN87_20465, partial [Desulfuromonadales bacterium]|nr:hypothetical protein [Desulfuromonadales bacterium]
EFNYNFNPDLTLTSVTGYYDLEQKSMINGTNSGYAPSILAADPDFYREDVTQEFRLTSDYTDSPFDFVIGAFYQDAKMTYKNNLLINTALYDEFENFAGLPA